MEIDIGIRLRELRRLRGMTQGEVSERTGLGVKTISSFENDGTRARSIKLRQLETLLDSYEVTIEQFFGPQLEAMLMSSDTDTQTEELLDEVRSLPRNARRTLVPWMRSVVRGAVDVNGNGEDPVTIQDAPFEQYVSDDRDWELLVCPN